MKVHEQGDALIDALAEQYSAEDLPGALGDVFYAMLVRAADCGAGGFDLQEMLHSVYMRWNGEAADQFEEAAQFEEALYGDDPFGAASTAEVAVPDITATCSNCGSTIVVCDHFGDEYVWYHYTPSNCDDPDVIPGTVVVNGSPPLGAS